ncbi:hypothetical protein RCL1_007680 [Eukaryota sp. TZLM3-RCL]
MTHPYFDYVHRTALEHFLRFVSYDTQSDPTSHSSPSTISQVHFIQLLSSELRSVGYCPILSDSCTLYVCLPATNGLGDVEGVSFLAHIDTSPDCNGSNVNPVIHRNYQGGTIKFDSDPLLELTQSHDPSLANYIGEDIITSDGTTLLGADDKAGVAALFTVLLAIKRFKLPHGPLSICFTCDEEIGRGSRNVDLDLVYPLSFTVDGGEEGSFTLDCFDAWGCSVVFEGFAIDPSNGHDKLVNASLEVCRFVSMISSSFRVPEHSHGLDNFVYVKRISGNCEYAEVYLHLRSFYENDNCRVRRCIENLAEYFENSRPGLKVTVTFKHQYPNMGKFFDCKNRREFVENLLSTAISIIGLTPKLSSFRGGTDGCYLCQRGVLCANIFNGGHLFHSMREFCPSSGPGNCAKAVLAVIDLLQAGFAKFLK